METTNLSANVLDHPTYIPSIGAVSNAGPCHRYSQGHKIHPIQMRAANRGRQSWKPATITEVEGNTITLESGGTELRLWNHDAPLLSRMRDVAVIDPHAVVEWIPIYQLLSVTLGDRALVVYLSDQPHTQCEFAEDGPPHAITSRG